MKITMPNNETVILIHGSGDSRLDVCPIARGGFGEIEVFYDGNCPLCRREIGFLKKKDRKRLIHFRDIQRIDFASAGIPKTYQQLMAEIHGRLPDGTWIKGVEVFRRLYDAIGWNWIVAITRWPIVRQSLDWSYQFFAKRRLAFTGRCLNSCEVKKG